MSDDNSKKSSGKGKFLVGAALGAIAGAIAGHLISKKMQGDDTCGCDHEGACSDDCPCDESCSCKAEGKADEAKDADSTKTDKKD